MVRECQLFEMFHVNFSEIYQKMSILLIEINARKQVLLFELSQLDLKKHFQYNIITIFCGP